MIIKIEELREATDWQVPIFVKMGATRVYDDVKLAAKAGADVVVIDGMGYDLLCRRAAGGEMHGRLRGHDVAMSSRLGRGRRVW